LVSAVSFRVAALAALVGGAAGCIQHETAPAFALYPGPRLEHDQVALLIGPVASVDGSPVPQDGKTFELLPRCHVVTTQTKLLAYDNSTATNPQGEVTGTVPRQTYAFDMRAGHSYVLERQVQEVGGNSVNVTLSARDVDPAGHSTNLSPARTLEELAACRGQP
jgi:hypothetical protein